MMQSEEVLIGGKIKFKLICQTFLKNILKSNPENSKITNKEQNNVFKE